MSFHGKTNTLKPFEKKIWLASPSMHGEEAKYMMEAYETNWMSTVGKNINEVEAQVADYVGVKYAVALSCGTAALHLATKLAGEKLYGQARPNQGTLQGHRVFCSDMTFDAYLTERLIFLHFFTRIVNYAVFWQKIRTEKQKDSLSVTIRS